MYVNRLQLRNYGPIEQLDIAFPFEGAHPKPVVLVGQNGSGKSIALSHIVNGILTAQHVAFPDTPEVDADKVYKVRSPHYIKSGSEFAFSKVEYQGSWEITELTLRRIKETYASGPPHGISTTDFQSAWDALPAEQSSLFQTNLTMRNRASVERLFADNCVLFFPPNRFEEPAWLNQENLNVRPEHVARVGMQGHTDRQIVNYGSLRANQNWVYEVLLDWGIFQQNSAVSVRGGAIWSLIQRLMAEILGHGNSIGFTIGDRNRRAISLAKPGGPQVPNVFQLSTGEVGLIDLFLSILRDYDLTRSSWQLPSEIRGLVVVDEIDLHLHAYHQHEVLPKLVQMFPAVQFIVTSHSPLFVLGLQNTFGVDGFALYRLPEGDYISPEEFAEFGAAYSAFRETVAFSDDVRAAIAKAQKPLLFVDGTTDIQYLTKAAELLDETKLLSNFEIRDGRGDTNLTKVWQAAINSDLYPQPILVLHDCDGKGTDDRKGTTFRRKVPQDSDHPIKRGIENLFSLETIQRAKAHKDAFINVEDAHSKTVRGEKQDVPETWTVDKDEKTNLCNWLCEEGTQDDFKPFAVVFDILREVSDQF